MMVKLITQHPRLGRFIVGRLKIGGKQTAIEVIGPSDGFDTYDDAEVCLRQINAHSPNETVLILQVTGEFRARTTLVAVEPMS